MLAHVVGGREQSADIPEGIDIEVAFIEKHQTAEDRDGGGQVDERFNVFHRGSIAWGI